MTERDRRQGREDAALAANRPDQALDELEEEIFGRRMDQLRDEDDDENQPADGHDLGEDDFVDGHGTVEHGPGSEPP